MQTTFYAPRSPSLADLGPGATLPLPDQPDAAGGGRDLGRPGTTLWDPDFYPPEHDSLS